MPDGLDFWEYGYETIQVKESHIIMSLILIIYNYQKVTRKKFIPKCQYKYKCKKLFSLDISITTSPHYTFIPMTFHSAVTVQSQKLNDIMA